MSNNEIAAVERIRQSYTERKPTKFDELRALNERVKRPANIFAYAFGTVGALVLGVGMSLAMKIIGNAMIGGIAIGLAGIAMVTANYFIYKKILKTRKQKYASEILAISDELLNK
ncbi:MAG: dihydropteridine reductase [Clostridia bacterium]|nr:dihydropteridine reductase [Clostridia bacterium]